MLTSTTPSQSITSNNSFSDVQKTTTTVISSVYVPSQIGSPKDSASKVNKDSVSSVEKTYDSSVRKDSVLSEQKVATIVSSVYKRFSRLVEDKEESLVDLSSSLPEQKVYSFPFADATESLTNFAAEFVNSIINKAQRIIRGEPSECEIEEDIDEMDAKKYPKTKEAKDSRPFVFEMAEVLIQRIIDEAVRRVDQIRLIGVERFASYFSVDDFKMKDGLEIIARCVTRWSFNPHWYFNIIYNGRSINDIDTYFYTVCWSCPSLAYPVAQVTVDIYFTIEVVPMTPPPVHIQVCFRLETDRCNRCALRSPFLEKWLHTVFKRKLETFQMFTF